MNNQQNSIIKTTTIAGFAIFLMFFGGGNLVFPIVIGTMSGPAYIWALLGVVLSAVLVPLLGLLGIMRHDGDYPAYFKGLGKTTGLVLIFTILSILCPLGCIPRNITVSFAGFEQLYPETPLWIFSLIYCLVTAFCIFKWKSLVETLGKLFTPIFLFGVFFVIAAAIWARPELQSAHVVTALASGESFWLGLTKGYLTMDLIASYFFAGAAYLYLKQNVGNGSDKKALLVAAVKASIIAAILLAVIYAGFAAMGARYAQELHGQPHANYLPLIITNVFGPKALPVATLIIIVACFTTLIALVAAYADFFANKLLPAFGITAISYKQAVWATLLISYSVSLVGFKVICDFAQIALDILYPALIAYAILKLLVPPNMEKRSKLTFWGGFIISLAGKLYSL